MNGAEALSTAHRIGRAVAARYAGDVDSKARFPVEAIDALKEARLMSIVVPKELGGAGMSMTQVAAVCTALGQYCASTGMIFAMHQIQVACIVRHGLGAELLQSYCRELVERQMLIGSVTSEVGTWGDTRSSVCAVQVSDGHFQLEKDATTISYGASADDLLITCRRAPDAPRGDQVLVLARKNQFSLQQTTNWDTLGMRGTCSPGFRLKCAGPAGQIIPGSFADACSETMVPYSHILWSALWLGLATEAVARAATFVRAEARRNPGVTPSSALRLADVSANLQPMAAHVHDLAAEVDRLEQLPAGREALLGLSFALKMNHLKVASSRSVVEIVRQALLVTGIAGYKNDSEFSMGRLLRDALSAELMIGNDRIRSTSASMLLVHKDE